VTVGKYLLLDGGGSTTKAYLYDGSDVNLNLFPSSSISTVGMEVAVRRIVEIAKSYGQLEGISISLAGLDSEPLRRKVSELLTTELLSLASVVKVEHDAHVVLLSNANRGCIVISGTGTIAYGYDGVNRYVMGDRGWLVGDVGGGFWLGREALRLALREFQGLRGSRSVSAALGFDSEEKLVEFLYNNSCSQDKVASFAPTLLKLIEDEEVLSTVKKGIEELAQNVMRVCNRVNTDTVYYHGGMFNSPTYIELFTKSIGEFKAFPSNPVLKGLGKLLNLEL